MTDGTELARRVLEQVLVVIRAELIGDGHYKTGQLDAALDDITASDGVASVTVPAGYEWLHDSVYVDLERDEIDAVADAEIERAADEIIEETWEAMAAQLRGKPGIEVIG